MKREMTETDVSGARALASTICIFLENIQVDPSDPVVILALCNLIAAYTVELGGGEDMLKLCHNATVEAHQALAANAKLLNLVN